MANGTHDERIARADRIEEQSKKAQALAEQNAKATQNSIANIRRGQLSSYSGEDETSEVKFGPSGLSAKGAFPREGRLAIAFSLAILIVAAAIVAVLKAWPR